MIASLEIKSLLLFDADDVVFYIRKGDPPTEMITIDPMLCAALSCSMFRQMTVLIGYSVIGCI